MNVRETPATRALVRAVAALDAAIDSGTETPELIAARDAAQAALVDAGYTPGQIAFLYDLAAA